MIRYELKLKEQESNTFNLAMAALRIVFMGTPEFAVASLDALVKAGCTIVGVITAPDKPAGRGMKLTESPVKKYAIDHHLHVLQPEKLKDPQFLEELRSLKADLQIVVAFRMLPEVVWNMPPKGTVNLHGSLLPQYRGAAPINWAIINGEKETGVTTFKLKQEIDTGDILLQESFPIGDNETAGEVHDRMKEIGAKVLVKTVRGLAEGSLKEVPQKKIQHSSVGAHYSEQEDPVLKSAPKIFAETCKIDWTKTVAQVHNLIRGLSPFPGAFTYLNDKMLKIYKSSKDINEENRQVSGSNEINELGGIDMLRDALQSSPVKTDGKTFLKFACTDGYISIEELQLEGRKKMKTEDFLRGYSFE